MALTVVKYIFIPYFLILLPTAVKAKVFTEQSVTGWKGDSVRLSCSSNLEVYGLYWYNSTDIDTQAIAQIFNKNKKSTDDRFSVDDDYSLVISDVRVSDEGEYVCKSVTSTLDAKQNTTELTVNARASSGINVQQCDSQYTEVDAEVGQSHESGRCTYTASPEFPNFNLDCKVTGFKPDLNSLVWRGSSGEVVSVGEPDRRELQDGTGENTISVSVGAKEGVDQNFTCEAEGVAIIDGRATYTVTVLGLPTGTERPQAPASGGLSATGSAMLVIFFILPLIIVITLAVLIMLDRNKLLPETVSAKLHYIPYIPFLKREEQIPPEEQRAMLLAEKQKEKREELRKALKQYEPGDAAEITLPESIAKVNINLFGQMSAGKSTFINTLNYAAKGVYKVVHEEGSMEAGGGKTRDRLKHPLTDHINLVDNRGMQSFSTSFIPEVQAQIRGERGTDPTVKIVYSTEEECHCAIFVYHDTSITSVGRDEALRFIDAFVTEVHIRFGRSPMIVITHKESLTDEDVAALTSNLEVYNVPKDNIFFFENYTRDDHEENVEKDIELLKFILHALDYCDRNIGHIERKKGETPIIEKKRERKGIGLPNLLQNVIRIDFPEDEVKPPPKKSEPEQSRCSVM